MWKITWIFLRLKNRFSPMRFLEDINYNLKDYTQKLIISFHEQNNLWRLESDHMLLMKMTSSVTWLFSKVTWHPADQSIYWQGSGDLYYWSNNIQCASVSMTFFPLSYHSVSFRTTPMDSTGVPHILEHTVLCGSQKYPVRDPFFKMLNRSLSTFMNAMTCK